MSFKHNGYVGVVGKAALIWAAVAALAVANGILREALLKPRVGERFAHVLSTLLLAAAVLIVAFAFQAWIGTASIGEAWFVSIGWLAATLAFEFIAGHYAFGNSWTKIFADYNVGKGRVWILVPFTILFAEPLAFNRLPAPWLIPYLVSNIVGAAILLFAVAKPSVARWSIAVLFLYAGIYNNWLGLTRPMEYQGFADMAIIPWYKEFIRGPLRESGGLLIPAIGVGQLLIAGGAAIGGRWLTASMMGCCLFLLAIAPLGVGSACPFSFVVSLAASVVATEGASKR